MSEEYCQNKSNFTQSLFEDLVPNSGKYRDIRQSIVNENYFFDHTTIRSLAKGHFTARGLRRSDELRCTVHAFLKSDIRKISTLHSIVDEITVMRHLAHPFISQIHDSWSDADNIYLSLDVCERDLGQILSEEYDTGMPLQHVHHILLMLVDVLGYMHNANFSHGDLRPGSISAALGPDGTYAIKLMNFSSALRVEEGSDDFPTGLQGAVTYAPPEVFTSDRPYDPMRADVWALGCLLNEMILGEDAFHAHWKQQFDGLDSLDVFTIVPDRDKFFGGLDVAKEICQLLGKESGCRELIGECLHIQPQLRPSVENIVQITKGRWSTSDILARQNRTQAAPNRTRGLRRRIVEDTFSECSEDEVNPLVSKGQIAAAWDDLELKISDWKGNALVTDPIFNLDSLMSLDSEAEMKTFIPGRILIVDDDKGIHKFLKRRLLSQLMVSIDVASSAVDGLSRLKNHPYSLIITDLSMPGTDGYEFALKIKNHEKKSGLKRTHVYSLSSTQPEKIKAQEERLDYRFDAHVSKPVDIPELIGNIKRSCLPKRQRIN